MTCAYSSTPHGLASNRLRSPIRHGHGSVTWPAYCRRKLPWIADKDHKLASLRLPIASFPSVGWTAPDLWQDTSDDLHGQQLASIHLHLSTIQALDAPSGCTDSASCSSTDAISQPLQRYLTKELWINQALLTSHGLHFDEQARRLTCKLASDGLPP